MQAPLPRRPVAGYSLMEMLVVLVMIGIIASLAAPSMRGYVGRMKTRRALDQIAADLAMARMAAVRTGRQSTVRFVSGSDYRVEVNGANSAGVRNVRLGRDYAGVVIAPPTAPMVFNSRGLLVSGLGGGYIVASLGAMRDSLLLTPAGRVYRDF